ncbi:MAG: glycoside hydrolase 100 family protein [Bryobacteraceae bacterium]|nr:glycoside hydrolase 100 family protein [Bryobacteraceae bacterium]
MFPYILAQHAGWRPRYERYNRPGEYHNGGVGPFVCGFYVAACVAAGRMGLARRKLLALTELVKPWRENEAEWGFNEWIKAQTGAPSGRDWQTWTAAMYLYAAECVRQQGTLFFCDVAARNGTEARRRPRKIRAAACFFVSGLRARSRGVRPSTCC